MKAYERIKILQKNIDDKLIEIDKWRIRYYNVLPRKKIMEHLEKTILKLDSIKDLDFEQGFKEEHTEEYYEGMKAAFTLVLSHIEEKELMLKKYI